MSTRAARTGFVHASRLRLTLPANVDWYLTRTALHFHHNNCSDDQVVPIGQLTQTKLILQSHHTKQGFWDGCDHTNTTIFAQSGPWNGDQHFFLQPNDSTHRGSEVPTDWKVYGHVYRNSIAGINVQYWFFYAYNDNVGSFNHEGDWESITVRLRYDETIDGIYFCAHGDCSTFWTPNYLTWVDGTHPVAWVADGSHATYPSLWKCQNAPWWAEGDGPNCQQKSAYRWWTWPNGKGSRAGYQGGGVINVGERGAPLNGQHFIRYYSRWGELGTTSTTSGPRTPSYQNDWLLDAAP